MVPKKGRSVMSRSSNLLVVKFSKPCILLKIKENISIKIEIMSIVIKITFKRSLIKACTFLFLFLRTTPCADVIIGDVLVFKGSRFF